MPLRGTIKGTHDTRGETAEEQTKRNARATGRPCDPGSVGAPGATGRPRPPGMPQGEGPGANRG
eukprot:5424281-Lingulodinium_polyedra.AAC.1